MKITEGPWFVSLDEGELACHENSGLLKIDTGRVEDFPIARCVEGNNAKAISVVPEFLKLLEWKQGTEIIHEADCMPALSGYCTCGLAQVIHAIRNKLEESPQEGIEK